MNGFDEGVDFILFFGRRGGHFGIITPACCQVREGGSGEVGGWCGMVCVVCFRFLSC